MNTDFKEQTVKRYEEYVNPSLARLFRFMGMGVEYYADGTTVYDASGNQYLDCVGGYGVFSLGHRHPRVVERVKAQLDKMAMSTKVFFSPAAGMLAEQLGQLAPGDLQYSFFCNSGTEAVEGALKLARIKTGRTKIVACHNSFHGKSMGALSVTGRDLYRQPFEPLLPDVHFVKFGDLEQLSTAIDGATGTVIMELIQGEGGINLATAEYFQLARELCDQQGAVLIFDEVQTGLGRTGKMFACDHYGVTPDIMTLAKALGGGVMPIGAFVTTPEVWQTLVEHPFLHTSTFGGSPLACVAALATLEVIKHEDLCTKAAERGHYFMEELQKLQAEYPQFIKEVRGLGLLLGIELQEEGLGGFLLAEALDRGLLVAYTLNNPKVIRIEPPLTITLEQIQIALHILRTSFAKLAIEKGE